MQYSKVKQPLPLLLDALVIYIISVFTADKFHALHGLYI